MWKELAFAHICDFTTESIYLSGVLKPQHGGQTQTPLHKPAFATINLEVLYINCWVVLASPQHHARYLMQPSDQLETPEFTEQSLNQLTRFSVLKDGAMIYEAFAPRAH